MNRISELSHNSNNNNHNFSFIILLQSCRKMFPLKFVSPCNARCWADDIKMWTATQQHQIKRRSPLRILLMQCHTMATMTMTKKTTATAILLLSLLYCQALSEFKRMINTVDKLWAPYMLKHRTSGNIFECNIFFHCAIVCRTLCVGVWMNGWMCASKTNASTETAEIRVSVYLPTWFRTTEANLQ